MRYDIFRYQRDFAAAYNDIVSRGRPVILCGGSGLYIESVTRNYAIPEVPSNPALRAELEQHSDEYLIDMLKSLSIRRIPECSARAWWSSLRTRCII